MAEIVLARIDSRLIHGQVVAKWMKTVNANQIVVIDDNLAKDPVMSSIYSMAAPPGCKVSILSTEKAVAEWKKDGLGPSSNSTIILFKDVKTALAAWEAGLILDRLQVGGLGGGPSRKAVFKNITLDGRDAEELTVLQNGGVKIFFQTVPEDTPGDLESALKALGV